MLEYVKNAAFWEDSRPCVLINPKAPYPKHPELQHWLENQPDLASHVLFQTSGTESGPKFVALSRRALLASATAVNAHLKVTSEDRWFGALPLFHVGGIGVVARAHQAQTECQIFSQRWCPSAFVNACDTFRASLTSLVPTQVYDLVERQLQAPKTLRALLTGGGVLEHSLEKSAISLGWPILKTYGMTETASQVATQAETRDWLDVLPLWDLRTDTDGRLLIKGDALFTGYVEECEDSFILLQPFDTEGYFRSHDRVERQGTRLRFLKREAHMLKIRGDLVNLQSLRDQLGRDAAELAIDPRAVTIAAASHPRDGHHLALVIEKGIDGAALQKRFNETAPPAQRLRGIRITPEIPRSPLGKNSRTGT